MAQPDLWAMRQARKAVEAGVNHKVGWAAGLAAGQLMMWAGVELHNSRDALLTCLSHRHVKKVFRETCHPTPAPLGVAESIIASIPSA